MSDEFQMALRQSIRLLNVLSRPTVQIVEINEPSADFDGCSRNVKLADRDNYQARMVRGRSWARRVIPREKSAGVLISPAQQVPGPAWRKPILRGGPRLYETNVPMLCKPLGAMPKPVLTALRSDAGWYTSEPPHGYRPQTQLIVFSKG